MIPCIMENTDFFTRLELIMYHNLDNCEKYMNNSDTFTNLNEVERDTLEILSSILSLLPNKIGSSITGTKITPIDPKAVHLTWQVGNKVLGASFSQDLFGYYLDRDSWDPLIKEESLEFTESNILKFIDAYDLLQE